MNILFSKMNNTYKTLQQRVAIPCDSTGIYYKEDFYISNIIELEKLEPPPELSHLFYKGPYF